VSISGYHIAEAGANPISQLAFTLSNGFTFVEAYLARGMHIDDFAPNLSFFFSNGMDPEYTVMGRVARRIWAVAMKEKYGANERSQKLKYHIQTSGRSLHAQEIQFNDIRTTLQALIAIYDNCNSLHTNAFDEAITTPTEDSVRRAMAIQLIINREWGLAKNENPNQGAFIIEELTELVEEAVLPSSSASPSAAACWAPWRPATSAADPGREHALRDAQAHRRAAHHRRQHLPQPARRHRAWRSWNWPARPRTKSRASCKRLRRLPAAATRAGRGAGHAAAPAAGGDGRNGNVFEVLMDAVRVCSLGQITNALFEVGGQYRRNMYPTWVPATSPRRWEPHPTRASHPHRPWPSSPGCPVLHRPAVSGPGGHSEDRRPSTRRLVWCAGTA
jgi:methylmalonyl-CoA mutase